MSYRIYKHLVSSNVFGIRDKIKQAQKSNKRYAKKELNKVLIYIGLPLWIIAISFVALCIIINDLWFLN